MTPLQKAIDKLNRAKTARFFRKKRIKKAVARLQKEKLKVLNNFTTKVDRMFAGTEEEKKEVTEFLETLIKENSDSEITLPKTEKSSESQSH